MLLFYHITLFIFIRVISACIILFVLGIYAKSFDTPICGIQYEGNFHLKFLGLRWYRWLVQKIKELTLASDSSSGLDGRLADIFHWLNVQAVFQC